RALQTCEPYQTHSQNGSTNELHLRPPKDYQEYLNKSLNEECLKKESNSDFKPGHRKTNSLETNCYLMSVGSRNNSPKHNKSSRSLNINLIDDSPIYPTY